MAYIAKPTMAGAQITYNVKNEKNIDFLFSGEDASFQQYGNSIIATFDDGSKVILQNFFSSNAAINFADGSSYTTQSLFEGTEGDYVRSATNFLDQSQNSSYVASNPVGRSFNASTDFSSAGRTRSYRGEDVLEISPAAGPRTVVNKSTTNNPSLDDVMLTGKKHAYYDTSERDGNHFREVATQSIQQGTYKTHATHYVQQETYNGTSRGSRGTTTVYRTYRKYNGDDQYEEEAVQGRTRNYYTQDEYNGEGVLAISTANGYYAPQTGGIGEYRDGSTNNALEYTGPLGVAKIENGLSNNISLDNSKNLGVSGGLGGGLGGNIGSGATPAPATPPPKVVITNNGKDWNTISTTESLLENVQIVCSQGIKEASLSMNMQQGDSLTLPNGTIINIGSSGSATISGLLVSFTFNAEGKLTITITNPNGGVCNPDIVKDILSNLQYSNPEFGQNPSVDTGNRDGSLSITQGDGQSSSADIGLSFRDKVNGNFTAGTTSDSFYYEGDASDNKVDLSQSSGSNLIVGGEGNNTLIGGSGGDIIITGGQTHGNNKPTINNPNATGNSSVNAGAGNDTILGSAGSNTIDGGSGNDLIFGGTIAVDANGKPLWNSTVSGTSASNTLLGGEGNDTIIAGTGGDLIYGDTQQNTSSTATGGGNNVIYDGKGNDTIHTGGGNNTVYVSSGSNQVYAGAGNDIFFVEGGNNTIQAGNGTNTVTIKDGANSIESGMGNDSIQINAGNNTIAITAGNNTINVTNGSNSITTGSGSDSIQIIAGNNSIHAGEGNNTISVNNGTNTIQGGSGTDSIIISAGTNTVNAGDGNNTITVNNGINNIQGGSGTDSILISAGTNTVNAGDGRNTIELKGGTSSITTGNGEDKISVTGGTNHTINTGSGNDSITVTGGTGTIHSGDGNDSLYINGGSMNVHTGSGNDTITIVTGSGTLNTGTGNNLVNVQGGSMNITTGSGSDTVNISGGTGTINTGDGADKISISGGNVTINTGIGNDSITITAGEGTLNTGDGNNVVHIAGGSMNVSSGNGNNVFDISNGNGSITTGNGSDTIHVSGGNLNINTGSGNDSVVISGGNNTISTGSGNDTITITNGSGSVNTGDGNNVINVSGGNMNITSTNGNDSFFVSGGSGTINTGSGSDKVVISGQYNGSINFGSGGNDILGVTGSGTNLNNATVTEVESLYFAGNGSHTISGANLTTIAKNGEHFVTVKIDGKVVNTSQVLISGDKNFTGQLNVTNTGAKACIYAKTMINGELVYAVTFGSAGEFVLVPAHFADNLYFDGKSVSSMVGDINYDLSGNKFINTSMEANGGIMNDLNNAIAGKENINPPSSRNILSAEEELAQVESIMLAEEEESLVESIAYSIDSEGEYQSIALGTLEKEENTQIQPENDVVEENEGGLEVSPEENEDILPEVSNESEEVSNETIESEGSIDNTIPENAESIPSDGIVATDTADYTLDFTKVSLETQNATTSQEMGETTLSLQDVLLPQQEAPLQTGSTDTGIVDSVALFVAPTESTGSSIDISNVVVERTFGDMMMDIQMQSDINTPNS